MNFVPKAAAPIGKKREKEGKRRKKEKRKKKKRKKGRGGKRRKKGNKKRIAHRVILHIGCSAKKRIVAPAPPVDPVIRFLFVEKSRPESLRSRHRT